MPTFEGIAALGIGFFVVLTMSLVFSGLVVGLTLILAYYALKKADEHFAHKNLTKALHQAAQTCAKTGLWTSVFGLLTLGAIEVSTGWKNLTTRVADYEAVAAKAVAAVAEASTETAAPTAAADVVRNRRTQQPSRNDNARSGSL